MAETTQSTRPQTSERPDIDPKTLPSTALARLIEEVRNDPPPKMASAANYNRTYHRHNR